jgi:hypothetical protein
MRFDDDFRLEGVLEGDGEFPQVVISQPFVMGRPSTPEEIAAYHDSKGFLKTRDGSWYNATTRIRVTDAVPNNLRTFERDQLVHVVSIDVQVTRDECEAAVIPRIQ